MSLKGDLNVHVGGPPLGIEGNHGTINVVGPMSTFQTAVKYLPF